MPDDRKKVPEKDDERLAIPLDPQEALRALLKVAPESEPAIRSRGKSAPDAETAP